MKTILDDNRTIKCVQFDDPECSGYWIDENGVTKIEAYGEPGAHCDIPFFAVYCEKEIVARIPANQVSVFYYTKKDYDA